MFDNITKKGGHTENGRWDNVVFYCITHPVIFNLPSGKIDSSCGGVGQTSSIPKTL